jgi:hypothetical protein
VRESSHEEIHLVQVTAVSYAQLVKFPTESRQRLRVEASGHLRSLARVPRRICSSSWLTSGGDRSVIRLADRESRYRKPGSSKAYSVH